MDANEKNEDKRVADILRNQKKGFFRRHTSLVADLWSFMKDRKKWWLLPILATLVIVGALVIFSHSSALSPFIYALF